MKKRPSRILAITLLTVVGALAMRLFFREPVARLSMPDGTELRLEYVTYGTEHQMPGAGRLKAWISRLAQRWPQFGIPVYEAEYTYAFEKPELVLWFTHFDPKTGKFLAAPMWVNVAAAEGDSTFVGADESAIPKGPLSGPPGPPQSSRSYSRDAQKDAPPMPNVAFVGSVYERRNPKLRLRFGKSDLTSIVTIPNPTTKTVFPIWRPEPLPQVRQVGELEVVLRSVKTYQNSHAVRPEFAVLHHGHEAQGIDWDEDWEILDATGNTGHSFDPPPFSEPAWKIRKPFARTGDFPFSTTEGQLLGPVRMPEAGKCAILPLSESHVKWGLRFAVLLGPGYYRWEGGVLVESRVPRPETEWWAPSAEPMKENTFVVSSPAPSVFFAYSPEGFEKNAAFDYGKVVRVRSGEEGYGLSPRRSPVGPSDHFDIGDHSLEGACYPLTRSSLPELSDTNPAKSLPAGSEVWIQVVPVKMEYLEFLVAPPLQTVEPDQSAPPGI